MTGKIMPLHKPDTSTVQAAAHRSSLAVTGSPALTRFSVLRLSCRCYPFWEPPQDEKVKR